MARFKPLTLQVNAPTSSGTASTVSDANVVRAVNTGAAAVLVTLTDADSTAVGSFTITAGEVAYIDKGKTQKVFAASTDVKLTSVTYPV
jgi:hypothetical protein